MRTRKEVEDRIKQLEDARDDFQLGAVSRKYSSSGIAACKEYAHQCQQEIQSLKWVLELAYWNGRKINADGSLNIND